MKKYSFNTRKLRELDNKIIRFKEDVDVFITSEEFITKFRVYVEDIARFKTVKGRKFLRPTDYSSIGIMDINDIYQEAYLAFLKAYSIVDWKRIDESENPGAELWAYLKKSTILGMEVAIRNNKDGMRITHWGVTQSKLAKSTNINVQAITSLFHVLDKMWMQNEDDLGLTKYVTDLAGAFLEVHMDEHLDLTRNGNRDLKKSERAILKALYGIDQPKSTYAELSEYYGIPQPTIRQIKKRAVKRLQSEESKEKIANFLHEYRINTQADTEKYRK